MASLACKQPLTRKWDLTLLAASTADLFTHTVQSRLLFLSGYTYILTHLIFAIFTEAPHTILIQIITARRRNLAPCISDKPGHLAILSSGSQEVLNIMEECEVLAVPQCPRGAEDPPNKVKGAPTVCVDVQVSGSFGVFAPEGMVD